jgi:hypothetical protein
MPVRLSSGGTEGGEKVQLHFCFYKRVRLK